MITLSLKKENNYLLFLLLWFAIIMIFPHQGVSGGLDVDSCNYGVVAKEILRSHHWLGLYDPVYQGVFYYHFPLCIWITALFFKFLGVTTFTAKLFSMLSGVALVGTVYYFGKLLKDYWTGFFAGISLLLTNHVLRLVLQCRMDIPVTLFITLAIFSFILAQRRSRLYYLLFGISTCLAIFSKDVFGLAPLAIVFIYLVLRLQFKEFIHPYFIAGLGLSIAPVLIWAWLDHGALLRPWFYYNFLHLLKSPRFNVPWYYYLWAILTKYFYFLPFAVYGGYLAVKEARRNNKPEFYLLIIWALIFPLAFSFGKQKLHYFILPIYPACALLTGLAFQRLLKEQAKIKTAAIFRYILIIGTAIMLSLPMNISSKRFIEAVKIAPVMDEILKQASEYEFMVYHYDTAAILFYSQQLTRVKNLQDKVSLETELSSAIGKSRFCFLPEKDFLGVAPSISSNYRAVLKHKQMLLVVDRTTAESTINLP